MHPANRRFALTLLCVVLALGLLFSGGGHLAFHGDDHGAGCDACQLVKIEAPVACRVEGASTEHAQAIERPALPPRSRVLPHAGRPRAPPALV